MNFKQFGDKHNKIIILIHGSFTTWEMWAKIAQALGEDYCVIIPVLGGHDTEQASSFLSIPQQAEAISDYIIKNFGKDVFAVIGFSLGGSIATELLAQGRLHICKVVIDAGVLSPFTPMFCSLSAAVITRVLLGMKKGKRKFKPMIAHIFSSDAAEYAYNVAINMTKQDCKNVFSSCFGYKIPDKLTDTDADVTYWYGTRENSFAKKSAGNIAAALPNVLVKIFKDMHHGELIERYPDKYIEELKDFWEKDKE